jgi:hypothetical protein
LRGTPGLPPHVVHSLHAATVAEHVPLASLLKHTRRGQPREAFTQAQLDAGFEIFHRDNEAAAAAPATGVVPSAVGTVPFAGVPPPGVPTGGGGVGVGVGGAPAVGATWPGGRSSVAGLPVPAAPLPASMMPSAAELAAWEMPDHEVAELNRAVFLPATSHLRGLRWSDWPLDGGNPFIAKITPANAASVGVADYFTVLSKRSMPMDLTRMQERATVTAAEVAAARAKSVKSAGPRRFPFYPSCDAFVEDAGYMVHNAKRYNVPRRLYHLRDSDGPFPHPSTLPVGEVGRGSVYAMAFDLEGRITAMLPALRAQEAEFRRHAWLRAHGYAAPTPTAGAPAGAAAAAPSHMSGGGGGGGGGAYGASFVPGAGGPPPPRGRPVAPMSVRFVSSGGGGGGGRGGGRAR